MEEELKAKEVTLQSLLPALVDAALSIEKVRVRSQVRQSHLAKHGKVDPETDTLLEKLVALEEYADGRVAMYVEGHPAYPWFIRVRGIGRENIGKVIGMVRVKPEQAERWNMKTGEATIVDLGYADTISALWKFAGYAVDNGHAPRRVKGGGKLTYNSQLRSMCWRLGGSLLKANGKFKTFYDEQKAAITERLTNEGIRILPTPPGKWMCESCGASWKTKGEITPCCDQQLIIKKEKEEPEGVYWQGHVHNMALRKMIKLFLACLWLAWREAEGLPTTSPYVIDKLGHDSLIKPEDMTDR